MELYQLTKLQYGGDLSGTGAFLAGGRWNTKGSRMLYTASTRSLALVQSLAHLVTVKNLDPYVIMVLYLPDDVSQVVLTHKTLPAGWQSGYQHTQPVGNTWAASQESLLLKVPSAIVPKEFNCLLNPLHTEFTAVKILELEAFSFDPRLKNEP